jgi:hypothetical protein
MAESRGLSLSPLRLDHIFVFRPHPLSEEEVRVIYGKEIKRALTYRMRESECYAVTSGDDVYAITGIEPDGMMWCLFSVLIEGNFIKMARASRDLIRFYHKKSSRLTCDIWDENESIMQWLAALGFKPTGMYCFGDHNLVRFVRCAKG